MVRKKELIEYLKSQGRFDENTDITFISELYYNLSIMRMAKDKVKKSEYGIFSPGDKDGKIWHPNPALKIYDTALNHVKTISSRLGLSDGDRRKLGIVKELDDDDDFD